MDADAIELKPNELALKTSELPVGAVYSNFSEDADMPLRIVEKRENGGIVVEEIDPDTGDRIGDTTVLDPVPDGGWNEFAPALSALPDPEAVHESPPAAPTKRAWRERARDLPYRTRWQIALSVTAGVVVVAVGALVEGTTEYAPIDSQSGYLAFVSSRKRRSSLTPPAP